MYIIVIGGGRLGYYLTRELLDEGHEVLMIEKDAEICDTVGSQLGSVCLRGDGCEAANLEQAGTARADMLVAVTGDDEDNLVACQVAKYKFNVPRTIARVRNPRNAHIFKELGVDVTVSSTSLIVESIEKEVPSHPLTHLLTIEGKGLEVVEIRIPEGASTIGKAVKELALPKGSMLLLVIRQTEEPLKPDSDTILNTGDQIIATVAPELEDELRSALLGS